MQSLLVALQSPMDTQAGSDAEGKGRISDGRDVLLIEKIFCPAVNRKPRQQLIARAQVQLGIAIIEIPIGQDE